MSALTATNALKCWECNNVLNGQEFCEDPFMGYSNDKHLVDCQKPRFTSYRETGHAVCIKKKIFYHRVNGTMIERSCYWQSDQTSKICQNQEVSDYKTIEFCQSCETDACNEGTVMGFSIMMLLVTSLMDQLVSHL